jgi:hypothetical protein
MENELIVQLGVINVITVLVSLFLYDAICGLNRFLWSFFGRGES